MLTTDLDLDLDFIDGIYFKAFSTQATCFARQAIPLIQRCGDPIRALLDRPELSAAHREACARFLETIAAHQADAEAAASEIEAFGRMCWRDDAPKVLRQAPPDARAQEASKQLMEKIAAAERGFLSDCKQVLEQVRQLVAPEMADWRCEPYVGVGVELMPIPGRDCYRNYVSGQPLLLGNAPFPIGSGAFDVADQGSPVATPSDDRQGHIVCALTTQHPLPPALFPLIKAIHAQVQFSHGATVWQRPAVPAPISDRMAPLVTKAFGTWYVHAACEAAAGCVNKALHPLYRARACAASIAKCIELPEGYRNRYQTLSALFNTMHTRAELLLKAARALVLPDGKQPIDQWTTTEFMQADAAWIVQIRREIDAAERLYVDLSEEVLAIAAENGLPSKPVMCRFALSDFTVELETTGSRGEVTPRACDESPLRLGVQDYTCVHPRRLDRRQQKVRADVAAPAAVLPASLDEPDGGSLIHDLIKWTRLPAALLPLFKSLDLEVTLALQTVVWPLQPKPDEAARAAERRCES